ncbi:conjugative transposon TraM protein [Dysgonomonas sp. PFB1-18]|uniref:conjugative transposon protein TraM n=1 Tax=unclassified Dysgonomonas TaxID=2630389 RepID=UPI0013D69389|nr:MULTISPECIES: conjugative transposon protein TraM [unclassified Dysgonomonas]MDH6310005.1 conjugative transposon TraM protein [Dysgonomonas sp. PF1-14]MDH6339914.1 conjugative transposon TraM protein [Dysgonomonas sp. PF1-16]MDH6381562.1 conjugative transposon TraM protein [Dysgonomonas sp. PFB1-18]MDH6398801.1 conjugative transposon TraM protein [Dysgonomonas sp. PF1-23]NDV93645.1 conjugative transposon protein TraM [Dysgonomonas sp. 521]
MSEQRGLSPEQKQKLKKYAVFALMAIVFAGCMWLIFAPSDADKAKEQESIGLNADIPDPDGGGLIGDKKDAYEQEQMQKNQKERMQSLQGYMDILENETKDKQQVTLSLGDEPEQKPQEKKEPINNSVSAYKDINKTLGNFYEQPKADPEKEEMKKKLEELEAKVNEKEATKSQMDEQLELMEKSYQMAAKYMPNVQQDNSSESLSKRISNGTVKSSGNGKTKVAPIRHIQNQTVSALSQRLSDEDYFLMYDQPRNTSFNTMGGEMGVSEKNTISAVIHDDQTVVDGQTTRLRLTEPFMAGTMLIPENTIITGVAKVQGERLNIQISSIEYQGTIIPVEMSTYDSDGQRGIYIPGSLEMNAAKEILANMGNSVGTSFTMTESTGAQLTSDLTKGAIQGLSAYMQKKIKEVKVTLKSGYKVMLMPKNS